MSWPQLIYYLGAMALTGYAIWVTGTAWAALILVLLI